MRTPLDRRDVVAIAVLLLIGVGIPFWLAAAAGTIGVPTLDDWLYMRAAEGLRQSGAIRMALHSAAVVGQLVLVQPLLWLSAGDAWAFTAFGLAMGALGLTCTYLLARRFLGKGSAMLVVLLVVAFPGFLRVSASFMTDVPAFALTMLSLLLGIRWFQGDGSRVSLAAAVAVGLVAVSIREFATAAPVAILIAAWARNRPGERWWLALLTGIPIILISVVLAFASAANRVAPGTPEESVIFSYAFLGAAFATVAVILLPAIVLFASSRISKVRPETIVAASITSLAVQLAPPGPLLGNVWTLSGIGGDLLLSGDRGSVFGGRLWPFFEQLAFLAAILVLALTFTWAQPKSVRALTMPLVRSRALQMAQGPAGPLVLFFALFAAEVLVYPLFGPVIDRYLYPMVPAAAILLLRSDLKVRFGRSLAISHAALLWLGGVALALAANSFAYDAARWREGEAAVGMGFDARAIDAGYEWVGYHADGRHVSVPRPFVLKWYYQAIPASAPCAVVSNSSLEGGVLTLIHIHEGAYSKFLYFGPAQPLYLYAASTEECPRLPPSLDVWLAP